MKKLMLLTGLAGVIFAGAAAFAADGTATNPPAMDADVPAIDHAPPAADQTPQPPDVSDQTAAPDAAAPDAVAPTTSATATVAKVAPRPVPSGSQGLIMNFHDVPIMQVLNYMSKVAGYIIHTTTEVSGTVTVWNDQPMTKDEAVDLLEKVLSEKGYGVLADGRTLTVMTALEARKKGILVKKGYIPEEVPTTPTMRTQIVPIHTLNVVQLIKELSPLMTPEATYTADEAANALVMTDTSANIHHMLEIIFALDNINSGASTVKVYPLKYADAKALVGMIKELFPATDNSASGGRTSFPGVGRNRGGGGFGGGGGGNPFAQLLGAAGADETGHTPTAKVNATSDDHGNALIVSAPDALIATIDVLVAQLDVAIEDATLVKVFHLVNADPGEMADLLTALYPDDTGADASRGAAQPVGRGGATGGRGGAAGGRGGAGAAASDQSAYMKKMTHVGAVPDKRTKSLVVTAGQDVMPGIIEMVAQLDESTMGRVTSHVIPLENSDPALVQQILQEQFQPFSTSKTSSGKLTTGISLIEDRRTTMSQQMNQSTSSSSSSSTSKTGL